MVHPPINEGLRADLAKNNQLKRAREWPGVTPNTQILNHRGPRDHRERHAGTAPPSALGHHPRRFLLRLSAPSVISFSVNSSALSVRSVVNFQFAATPAFATGRHDGDGGRRSRGREGLTAGDAEEAPRDAEG